MFGGGGHFETILADILGRCADFCKWGWRLV